MRKATLLHVVGARPNFPKVAPVYRAAARGGIAQALIHTGQHYSESMSQSFFDELKLPPPDVNLGVGSDSHAVQIAKIMIALEPCMQQFSPACVVVYGDVNSTVAAALVGVKMRLPVAHVEAGLRSFDRSMPEEINRIVVDQVADLLLTPSREAGANLAREGISPSRVVFVGNVMIDSVMTAAASLDTRTVEPGAVLVTLHRPSNVDDASRLSQIIAQLRAIAEDHLVIFPAHPRTRERLVRHKIDLGQIRLCEPMPYIKMIGQVSHAYAVITDSGGLQEECTALGTPCFTVRENTERPITITHGTNTLVSDVNELLQLVRTAGGPRSKTIIEGWDGRAGERVVQAISKTFGVQQLISR